MTDIPVLVVVDDDKDLHKVKASCEAHGLTQVRALPRLGMFKGLIDQARLGDLSKIPGVRSVEKEREVKLPPPGSRVQ
jgi:hypothetical protein